MSSLLLNPQSASEGTWMGSTCRNQYEQRRVPARADREATSDYCFTGGLPTPPGTKRMNLVSYAPVPPYTHRSEYPSNGVGVNYHPESQHGPSSNQKYVQSSDSSSKMNGYGGISMPANDNSAQNDLIASHLQVPKDVNNSKGSLSEFAAEIASLFWFESAETLKYAERLPLDEPTDRGLLPDAIPSIGFRKWVTTILSTTQVGKNVILLGLLFIYRLKQFNPDVSGKRGSEFRLLTIALMLGNKFLDDNTYTNKTWAEVSGISVTEIHIMEVEFLSNMRYELYVSAEEWINWKGKLGRLGAFYEKAARFSSRMTPVPVTPTVPNTPHKLPSPPSHHSSSTHFPGPQRSYNALPNPMLNAPQLQTSPTRGQRHGSVDTLQSRKRSLDLSNDQPAAKRIQYSSPQYYPSNELLTPSSFSDGAPSYPPAVVNNLQQFASDLPRLPMPRAPLAVNTMPENHLAPLRLPTTRAMANVYPTPSTASWSNPVTPISQPGLYQQPIPSLGEVSRSQSAVHSAHTSPNGYTLTPVQPGTSPSYFLTNRQSPYRPVRHVNTLLHPPPSAALQSQVRNVGLEQMHYQPLSKINLERRTGLVPYHTTDAYYQSNVNTPLTQKYPYHP